MKRVGDQITSNPVTNEKADQETTDPGEGRRTSHPVKLNIGRSRKSVKRVGDQITSNPVTDEKADQETTNPGEGRRISSAVI